MSNKVIAYRRVDRAVNLIHRTDMFVKVFLRSPTSDKNYIKCGSLT